MTGRTNREYRLERFPKGKVTQSPYKYRHPFWLPASSYYVLTFAITGTFFFVIWGILNDSGEETPWIPSGIAASCILGSAVIMREVVLRKARTRFLLSQQRLDYNVKTVSQQFPSNPVANKLTLEQNADIINEIQKKSEAAKVFGKLSEGHFEVFQVCNEYLSLNETQLKTVGVGSPRLAALRRGKEVVQKLHHFHLLAWTQNEILGLTRESKIRATIPKKLESSQKALMILESALAFYPNDEQLLQSEKGLKEFITSIKVSHRIDQAERAAFKGNNKSALNHYQEALFLVERDGVHSKETDEVSERITAEIEKLRVAPLLINSNKVNPKRRSEVGKQRND